MSTTRMQQPTEKDSLAWWSSLHHGGMLLDLPRLAQLLLLSESLKPISYHDQDRLRRAIIQFKESPDSERSNLVKTVLEGVCGFHPMSGVWKRGSEVDPSWARTALTGEPLKPSHLWIGTNGALLPVFIDKEKRIGIGRGARSVSQALQWMRKADHSLALITNGQQFRILYAGLSYEAFVEWDQHQWLDAGVPTAELEGLRRLLNPKTITPATSDSPSPFLEAINDSRKGQGDLTEILGERVRQAAELLVQGHAQAIASQIAQSQFTPQELYRASVRMIMRLVIVLFAESRDALLPRDNPIYFQSYSLAGLREQLDRLQPARLRNAFAAYPRILSLCRLIYEGSSHESLLVRAYGGQLFQPGDPNSSDGQSRALALLESGCYEYDLMNDQLVHQILNLLSRTKVRVRQGRQNTWVAAPVDFSALESEYIGILYEGLLDFELRQASIDQPVVFLNVGNQPALPLSTLEQMDDRALKNLLESMKDTSNSDSDTGEGDTEDAATGDAATEDADSGEVGAYEEDLSNEDSAEAPGEEPSDLSDTEILTNSMDALDRSGRRNPSDLSGASDAPIASRLPELPDAVASARSRAHAWAVRAVEVGGLVARPRGTLANEKLLEHQRAVDRKAKQLLQRVILPGEWYLVRWGGTRKGSGTFYTKPQLAIPTVVRTLEPLAYQPVPAQPVTAQPAPEPTPDLTSSLPGEYLESKALEHRHIGIDRVDQNQSTDFKTNGSPVQLVPRLPEEILSLKVCDPACGSGTFPLNALRYLTEALYESLQYHNRFEYFADRTVIDLIVDTTSQQTLADEKLPCRPEDNDFEARTKAVLRRYVVERCIYGVDLDPLAIELCRLSLWIETLDPRLPFTFLDHKIKCGNSLVGTWLDQFMHYPAMAWMREGGDKSHTNGVHFKKEAWTKQISSRVSDVKRELIEYIDGANLLYKVNLKTVRNTHDQAEKSLNEIHQIPVHDAQLRADRYQEFIQSRDFQSLRFSFDLWCAMWYWPADEIEHCPRPLDFYEADFSEACIKIVRRIAQQQRFFHWELEFPDTFNDHKQGFDAILGNPPWETLQPNSKEFFSAIDPLYRSYGNQEAKRYQSQYYEDESIERNWLHYNAFYKAMANWMKYSGFPYGDQLKSSESDQQEHMLAIGNRGNKSFQTSAKRHEKWRIHREETSGYADSEHSFRYQGGGKPYTHKLFMEMAHSLLRDGGRLGFIVPSGVYSDYGTAELRTLFLERCRWEWLFGFENREGIFDIHRSFKFNPLVIQKGGMTDKIRTAFMRRDLRDWEQAERYVTEYPRERVLQFSPRSKAILEIQSQRDLEVLEKIYSNGVLLGDDSPNGWGIKYAQGDFNMTSDSKLFPPRDKWEERGYRPDEYSRWLRGKWRPIEELYAELGVKPLAEGELRDAQPQYAHLPIPRADIPAGVILARDGRSYLLETEIDTDEFLDKRGDPITGPAIALPLYEGRMVGQFDFSQKGWVSGKGRSAVWREIPWENKQIEPQYLMAEWTYQRIRFDTYIDSIRNKHGEATANQERLRLNDSTQFIVWWINQQSRVAFMDVTSATNERTMIASPGLRLPYGNSAPLFATRQPNFALCAILSSFIFDFMARFRCGGLHLNYFVVDETALPKPAENQIKQLTEVGRRLRGNHNLFTVDDIYLKPQQPSRLAVTDSERLRWTVIQNVVVAMLYNLTPDDVHWIFKQCDIDAESLRSNEYTRTLSPKGFWRTQRTQPPNERVTVLTQIAMKECWAMGSTPENRITSFLNQNDGEGWQLPEEIDLGDYGLGDGSSGRVEVRSRFGPRYYGWQESQSVEESWRECHLHARNLLGPTGYASLLAELSSPARPTGASDASSPIPSNATAASSSAVVSSSAAASSTKPTSPGKVAPDSDTSPVPFDPDTFTLSNDPFPKKKKKR